MDYVELADPLQGTASEKEYSIGNTLPIVARPHGLHHWTLQTAGGNWWSGGWMFHPAHRQLWGVRLTHQPSPWMGDYAALLVTAFHGPAREQLAHQASAYRLCKCRPHDLRFELLRYEITCEMSPTERGALFVFQAKLGEALRVRLWFPAGYHIAQESGRRRFTGFTHERPESDKKGYGLFFSGEFDTAADQFEPLPNGGYWTFPVSVRRLEFRLAGSFIGTEISNLTLKRELRAKGLEELRAEGALTWNRLLGRLPIVGQTVEQERTFYSCLYRCLLFPRHLHEFDTEGKMVHRSPYNDQNGFGPLCTDNGFWDTHRTVYPLLALVYPDLLKEIMAGWLNACRQAGWAPKWASPGLRDCMIGTHFDAVVAEAVCRGQTDWDVEQAFTYLWKNATIPGDGGGGRRELEDYLRLGFIPCDKGYDAPVSCTLDYAYDDFCVAQVAHFLGRKKEAAILESRARNYRNVFDPSVGFMRERFSDRQWREPFREFAWGGGFVEGGPWQHTFNVPHDPAGLAELLGGPEALCRKLDTMLALPPTFEAGTYDFEIHEMTEMALAGFGQYAQSNQPVHGFLFLYSLMGQPEKTAHWVHRVADQLYGPHHFPGDEDNGEMSAWYIWAALGLYPQCPGKTGYVKFPSFLKKVPSLPEIREMTI